MMINKFLTLIFLLAVLASCDPMRRVIVKNASPQIATITWKLKEDSALHSPLFINTEKVTFAVGNNAPHNVMRLSFGIGNWKKADLKNLADDLEYLEIVSTSVNEKLASEQEINDFLSEHLRGILRKNIHINIE